MRAPTLRVTDSNDVGLLAAAAHARGHLIGQGAPSHARVGWEPARGAIDADVDAAAAGTPVYSADGPPDAPVGSRL